jgi:endonuclease-3
MDAADLREETVEKRRQRADQVLSTLAPHYPELRPMLDFETPFSLLVATVLSAQCTDAMVNRVTPVLFASFRGPAELAAAPMDKLEDVIHSTGFFHAKARNLVSLSRIIVERFAGEVPRTMEDLLTLPGVGRKTAGVVLSACFGESAIIVDTHFGRVSRRLGFARSENPERLETEIAALLPKEKWTATSHILNQHGRVFCKARNPLCADCPVAALCPSSFLGSTPIPNKSIN